MEKLKEAAALRYEPGKDNAPYIVASGRGLIAERILQLAKENNIPVFEDEQAADLLCRAEIGGQIPEALYQVIAEIYAFILRMDTESKGKLNINNKL